MTESGRGFLGPVRPSGSHPFMLQDGISKLNGVSVRPIDRHFDFDAKHTLSEQYMTHSVVNEVSGRLTRVDHEPVGELHRLSTSSTQFSGNNNFTALGIRLHNETKDTVACTGER